MFQINLLRFDPNWGISDRVLLIRKDLQRFIKHVVHKYLEGNNPETLTCKLQYYFEDKFTSLQHLPSLKRRHFMKHLSPLRTRSLEKQRNSSDSIKAAVAYIVLASGLGNPKDIKVLSTTIS